MRKLIGWNSKIGTRILELKENLVDVDDVAESINKTEDSGGKMKSN